MSRFDNLALSAAAIITIAIAGGVLYLNYERSRPEFRAALHERCTKRAERDLTAVGWRLDGGLTNGKSVKYKTHYNDRLDECFLLTAVTTVDTETDGIRKEYELGNLSEQASYAEYFESRTPDLAPFIQCKLDVPNEKPVFCHSAKEWDRLVKPYIEPGTLTEWPMANWDAPLR
jgi:hypothetical protein